MSESIPDRAVIVISGIPGVGKSTLSALLAQQLPRAVHLEAELLQRMIVSGGLWPDGKPTEEAQLQLRLRGHNVALLADSFFEARFSTVIDDVVIGSRLDELCSDLRSRPLYFVLLLPSLEVIRHRNAERLNKDVFQTWNHLDEVARGQTPRVGLRLDTSDQTPEESLDEILRRIWTEGAIE
jgi:tRNA uridine 5-carbamoylmethylation protein Kti12